MERSTIGFASYRWHRICNPFSLDQLARTLAFADLAPGDRAADLGCGNGFVAAWMAQEYGLDLTAIERFPEVAALARQAAAEPRRQGAVTVLEGSAGDYLARAGEHRLLSVLGAIDLLPGLRQPAEVIAALAPSIAQGGWLLWGDPFWKAPPGPRLEAIFGNTYTTLAGWVAAGQAAGLAPSYVAVSADAEWEEFFWRMNASLEAWAAERPLDPDAQIARQRAAILRTVYLEEGRERMGFALYLFRRPQLAATASG